MKVSPAPDGGLVLPNGIVARISTRGKRNEQNALVGDDGKIYSPIFKTHKELCDWLEKETGLVFVPFAEQKKEN